jgi:TonB family protein
MKLFATSVSDSKPLYVSFVELPRLLSILLHVSLVALALIPWAANPKRLPQSLINIALYAPSHLVLPPDEMKGGGGGGRHALTPASLGKLPRAADKQLAPPDPEPPKNPDPTLVVEQTLVAAQLPSLPQLRLLSIGDPDGVPGPPSAGPGNGNGTGTGDGNGVGDHNGPSYGKGNNGGCCGEGIVQIGGGVSEPVLIKEIRPEYSEEARKARYEGTVVLDTVVQPDGTVKILRVIKAVGYGLDQKAIAAVLQWMFKPARMNGKPVPVGLNIEVNFNLR